MNTVSYEVQIGAIGSLWLDSHKVYVGLTILAARRERPRALMVHAVQAEASHNCKVYHNCSDWAGGWPAGSRSGQDNRDHYSLEKHLPQNNCAQPRLQHPVGHVSGGAVPCWL